MRDYLISIAWGSLERDREISDSEGFLGEVGYN